MLDSDDIHLLQEQIGRIAGSWLINHMGYFVPPFPSEDFRMKIVSISYDVRERFHLDNHLLYTIRGCLIGTTPDRAVIDSSPFNDVLYVFVLPSHIVIPTNITHLGDTSGVSKYVLLRSDELHTILSISDKGEHPCICLSFIDKSCNKIEKPYVEDFTHAFGYEACSKSLIHILQVINKTFYASIARTHRVHVFDGVAVMESLAMIHESFTRRTTQLISFLLEVRVCVIFDQVEITLEHICSTLCYGQRCSKIGMLVLTAFKSVITRGDLFYTVQSKDEIMIDNFDVQLKVDKGGILCCIFFFYQN